MKALVLGAGGREHALAWKLSQEIDVVCAPGNAGIAADYETRAVKLGDHAEVGALAKETGADFVVVGPEDPLIAGIADALRADGVAVFGPGSDGARLEGSKAYSKRMMVEAGVPTAEYGEFTDPGSAIRYVKEMFDKGRSVAVKASGAALGKGVTVCATEEEAEEAVRLSMVEKVHGAAGETVIVEECLFGQEFSLLTLVSGTSFRSLPIAQDYKRIYDGDRGPNTGGMGTYSPVRWIREGLVEDTEERVVVPLLSRLAEQGVDFRGVLFSGLMVVGGEPYCLEYNVRFGDPEIQTIVRRLGGGFAGALQAVADGSVVPEFDVHGHAAVTVVMASDGYPGKYTKGRTIEIPSDLPQDVVVFHAGTTSLMGGLVTSGGRVLGVSATGSDLESTRAKAYDAVDRIEFTGKQFRTDIGA